MVYVFLFNSTYLVLTVTAASHSTDTDTVKSLLLVPATQQSVFRKFTL